MAMYTLSLKNCKTGEIQYLSGNMRTTSDISQAIKAGSAKALEGLHKKITSKLFRTGYFVEFCPC